MTARLITGMSRAEYDAIDADNWSSIRRIAKSPAHYKHGAEEGTEDTDALRFGRAAHLAVLEPLAFAAEVIVKPKFTGKGAVAAREEWELAHASKTIISESESWSIAKIRQAVAQCDFARSFLTGGNAEVTVTWNAEVVPGFRVPAKGRIDYVTADALVDLKFARCAAPEAFGRQAWDLGYLGQAAFYSDGHFAATGERKPFVFVVAEKEPPFCVAVYVVTQEQLAAGRAEYERLLSILSLCRIRNEWPGYVTGPQSLVLPKWAQQYAEESLNAEREEGQHVE
jgi:hypothetical protein